MENLMLSFEMLQAIAIMNPEGFTVSSKDFTPVKSGFSVAVAGTQNSFGNYGLAKVIAYVSKHPEINAIGGWYNKDNNQYYFDATIIVNDLATAIELGRANDQIAIFNLNTLEEIRL
jgi:hypothetical protein